MKLLLRSKSQWIWFAIIALISLVVIGRYIVIPFVAISSYEPRVGDIVFQSLPQVELVKTIEGCTHSHYSHCGVVMQKNGKWVVIEALGRVKHTSLRKWVWQGRLGRFAAYRLKSGQDWMIPKFIEKLETFLGLPYDYHYEMGDDSIYCSELVYKGFKNATGEKLGKLVTLGDLDWRPYIKTIEKYEGGSIPLDRVMITPRHLSEAHQLKRVYRFGL